jgi:hypothetical protein
MDSDQRKELESLVRAPTTPQRSVQRAPLLLASADGLSQQEAARQIGVRRRIVTKWCGRFRKLGLAGLADAGGRGRKPSLSAASRALILTVGFGGSYQPVRRFVRRLCRHQRELQHARQRISQHAVFYDRQSPDFVPAAATAVAASSGAGGCTKADLCGTWSTGHFLKKGLNSKSGAL